MNPTLFEIFFISGLIAGLGMILFEIAIRIIRFARKLNQFLMEMEEEQGMPVERTEKRRKP